MDPLSKIKICRRFNNTPFRCFLSLFISLCLMTGCVGGERNGPTTIPNTRLVDNHIIISDIKDIPANVTFNKLKAKISGIDWEIIATEEADYIDGKATLVLPTEFLGEKLSKVGRDSWSDYAGFWPAEEIDDSDAKVAGLNDILAYNGDELVGMISLTNWSGTGSLVGKPLVSYHYADRPFKLSGYNLTREAIPQIPKSFRYDASFKAGWNAYTAVNQADGGVVLITTSIAKKTALVWKFKSFVYVSNV